MDVIQIFIISRKEILFKNNIIKCIHGVITFTVGMALNFSRTQLKNNKDFIIFFRIDIDDNRI